MLFARGAAAFALTLTVIWPKGLLELSFVKGYLYLAYMAVLRKTFSPIGPLALWGFKIRTYPLEFVLPLACLAAALFLFRNLKYRVETLPFLVYACLFTAVTLKVTAPFTHYHVSLMTSAAVIVGVMCGELWRRSGAIVGCAAVAGIVASLILLDLGFYREQQEAYTAPSVATDVLTYLQETRRGTTVLVPYVLVPTLHYYRPELTAIGYDTDWSRANLMQLARERVGNLAFLCPESVCRQVGEEFANAAAWVPLGRIADQRDQPERLYAIQPVQKN
jgi:hypothetical protein